ncbi:hypothetical protein BH23CHL1_BH23CHL1_15690 [soil metagenome]
MRAARLTAVIMMALVAALSVVPAAAVIAAEEAFLNTWARTDKPVIDGLVNRTWMWGPQANTAVLSEEYDEHPTGQRPVQYWDKSRMEVTDPNADSSSIWYVTNGLLVNELTSGQMQVGNSRFIDRGQAQANVAGDADDPNGPTYQTIATNISQGAAFADGQVINGVIDRDGVDQAVGSDTLDMLAAFGVTAGPYSLETQKHTASVFWEFMTSDALVYNGGAYVNAPLFENPYYATGLPIDQAWWANVEVAGTPQWVLLQCFERRCLTYTPGNDPGWQVEAGNVGQHYYTWRYEGAPAPPPVDASFGAGMQQIGVDIQPGTYRNSDSSSGCYWERLAGFSGSLDEVITNKFTYGRDVVTIQAEDVGFFSERCGTWTSDLSAITAGPQEPFGDGTYIVGIDIAPGIWQNSDSAEGCNWGRLSGFGGAVIDDVIEDEFTYESQIVTISASDEGFSTSGCGVWTFTGS